MPVWEYNAWILELETVQTITTIDGCKLRLNLAKYKKELEGRSQLKMIKTLSKRQANHLIATTTYKKTRLRKDQ